jgi:hypothetical protein
VSALLFVLVFWVAPLIVAALVGDRKGYKWQGLVAALFLSWLGVLAVALWKPRRPDDAPPPSPPESTAARR